MNQNNEPNLATVSKKRSFSVIWIIPILALCIGLWMVYNQIQSQGPLIEVTFSTAEGIEVKKTKIKVREVNIGVVENVTLLDNIQGVKVSIRIDKKASKLLLTDTQFWVVSPQITNNGISGLNTLLSGPYIEMSPGTSGRPATAYTGLEEAPITPNGTPGLRLTLNSDKEFAFSAGDPIIYKGLRVGQIEEVSFNFDNRVVYYNAFIKAPYHQLVTDNTLFWNDSGLKLDLTTEGISIESSSIDTLITNGVTFGVPDGEPLGNPVLDNTRFDIFSSYESATKPIYKTKVAYVMLVSNSVRGLSVGAPIEYRGLTVGKVVAINSIDSIADRVMRNDYKIPVSLEFYPAEIGLPDDQVGIDMLSEQLTYWIKGGLKASLKTGNLLTGKLFIDLQHFPQKKTTSISSFNNTPVIPSIADNFALLSKKTGEILDKINKLPIEPMMTEIRSMVKEFEETAQSVNDTSHNIDKFLTKAEKEQLFKQLNEMIESFTVLAESYSEGSQPHEQASQAIENLNNRLQQLQPILLQLEQKPNSLIFSGNRGANRQPKAQILEGNE